MTYKTCIGSGSSWITPINKNLFAIQIIKILKLFVKPILKKGHQGKYKKNNKIATKKRKVYFLTMHSKSLQMQQINKCNILQQPQMR